MTVVNNVEGNIFFHTNKDVKASTVAEKQMKISKWKEKNHFTRQIDQIDHSLKTHAKKHKAK